ncbi:hypothetical protein N8T08_001389 [Aspergillus melleus]|uniref:Uncharacterized protein n=1 Tax=Aspergillus melleus TaxID=138277 RepID=A0ACC3B9J1_9EURO|nr:hypothetical protein N8T08_001389 [Aspergillus melleus]
MPAAAIKSRRSTSIKARMAPLKRLRIPSPKPVARLRLIHPRRPPIRDAPSLKAEFIHNRLSFFAPEKLGEGGWGQVHLMHERQSKRRFAVKEVFKSSGEKEQEYADRVYDEFDIASRLNHPNVIRTYRLRARRCRWCIVMEYCPNGDVCDRLAANHLKYHEVLCLFKQLLHGVEYLHSQGVAHRDIKVDNLLLNDVGHLKIADLGLATTGEPFYLSDPLGRCFGVCGTPVMQPPEILKGEPEYYDGRAFDVWSCAMSCLFMLYPHCVGSKVGTPSDKLEQEQECLRNWARHLKSDYWSLLPEARKLGGFLFTLPDARFRQLLLKMLHPEPTKRLTASQALNDSFIRQIECCGPAPNSRDQEPPARHYHGPPRFMLPVRLSLNCCGIKDPRKD